MEFFQHLDSDIKTALKAQLRDLWTHTSTAIEGNTLTLGETKFVIEEGLTVAGKPLKDHHEVVGHARAIELIYDMVGKTEIEDTDLFELHITKLWNDRPKRPTTLSCTCDDRRKNAKK
ncbi:hypothetical protein D1BOALGB6SA_9900 [Olavius sp. associated proteobacterium Delta 1]|nr:hypothetical protein D1BOALGB6SA_9900 [Olavius sp. associated proteobacterium Delta 1]